MLLLARDALRSEEAAEDLEATAANIAMHPVTGMFAAPHESAFAAHAFRLAFPVHTFLMALSLGLIVWMALTSPAELQVLWVIIIVCVTLGLVGRARLHVWRDSARSQRVGSWTWTILLVTGLVADMGRFAASPPAACAEALYSQYKAIAISLAIALVNGTHGLGFVQKLALMALILTDCIVKITVCGEAELGPMACGTGGVAALGAATAHMAEMHLRHSYAEKERTDVDKRQLKERNEQLQAEKERLMYDMLRRGQIIDDDSRSAIRRGLQAGPNEPSSDTAPSEAGCPVPSDSPPPSLPPGAPSSTADSSSIALPPDAEGAGTQSSCVETGASPPMSEAGYMEVEEAMKDLMGDEEVVLELQSILRCPPAQANPENVAVVEPRVIAQTVQEAVDSRPQEQGVKRERQEPHLPVGPPVAPSCCCQLPGSLDHGQDSKASRLQALHVARQSLQISRTDVEIFQVLRNLSLALGSTRTESGTIKAVHAVLLQLDRPGKSEKDAYTYTGASLSNFKKWRRRVHHAQLDLPPAP